MKNKMIKKFIAFCIVGVSAALVDLGIFNILFNLNIYFVLCRILAIGSAWTYVFTVNRNFTFNSKERIIKKQVSKFVIIYLSAMTINVLVSYLVIRITGENVLNGNIASVIGIIAVIPITFLGSMFWVFKN